MLPEPSLTRNLPFICSTMWHDPFLEKQEQFLVTNVFIWMTFWELRPLVDALPLGIHFQVLMIPSWQRQLRTVSFPMNVMPPSIVTLGWCRVWHVESLVITNTMPPTGVKMLLSMPLNVPSSVHFWLKRWDPPWKLNLICPKPAREIKLFTLREWKKTKAKTVSMFEETELGEMVETFWILFELQAFDAFLRTVA